MNKRYKQFWATIGGVGFLAVLLDSFPSLIKSIEYFLQSKQLTAGTFLMGTVLFFSILSTIRKESEKRKRSLQMGITQQRMERNQKKIMDHWGIEGEWSSPINGSEIILTHTSTTLYTLLQTVKHHLKLRRSKTMNTIASILKANLSKKLISALVSIGVASLNYKYHLNIPEEVVWGILGLSLTHISLQTIIDSIKAWAISKASTIITQATPIVERAILDPNTTYNDMVPTIREVHETLIKFLELARANDVNILSAYPQALKLLKSFDHPEPIPEVTEVSA